MASQTYNLNGATNFSFPYPVRTPSQITVEVLPGGAVAPSNYTIKGAGPNSTQATIIYPRAPTDGTKQLKITRYVQPDRVSTLDDPSDITVDNLDAEFNNAYMAMRDAGMFGLAYYGSLPADPTLDPQGQPVTEGDIYYNTVAHRLRVFNGTTWQSVLSSSGTVATTTKPTIVVIGDSICGEPRTSPSWSQRLPAMLREWGLDANVHNVSQNGATLYRMNGNGGAEYKWDGMLAKDKVASYNPDLIIVSLGFNDMVLNLDGRSPAGTGQVRNDYNKLRSDLQNVTNCPILFYPWSCWNQELDPNATDTQVNYKVIPYLMKWVNNERSGPNLIGSTSDYEAAISNYSFLWQHVENNTLAASRRWIPYFKVARLGHTLDGLHPTDAGNHFTAMAVANMLIEDWQAAKFSIPFWGNPRSVGNQTGRYKFEDLFNSATFNSFGIYSYKNSGEGVFYENYLRGLGFPSGKALFDSYFRYYRGSVQFQPGNDNFHPIDNDNNYVVTFTFNNMAPDEILYEQVWKVNTPKPSPVESVIRTDGYGNAVMSFNSVSTYTDGTWSHIYRYLAPDGINDVYDEIQVSFI